MNLDELFYQTWDFHCKGKKEFSVNSYDEAFNIPEDVEVVYWFLPSGDLLYKLPKSVKYLTFRNEYYNHSAPIPFGITHLEFNAGYDQPTPLPNSITHLWFQDNYNQPTPLPNSIVFLSFGYDYNQPTPLPNSIIFLFFDNDYDQPTKLPDSITHLSFGSHYNQPTKLPDSITHLLFSSDYEQSTPLPSGLKYLEHYGGYKVKTQFPDGIERIKLFYEAQQKIPKSVKEISIWYYDKPKLEMIVPKGTVVRHRNGPEIKKSKYIIHADLDEMKAEEKLLLFLKLKSTVYNEDILELFNSKLKNDQRYLYNAIQSKDDYKIKLCLEYGCRFDEKAFDVAVECKNMTAIKMCAEKISFIS